MKHFLPSQPKPAEQSPPRPGGGFALVYALWIVTLLILIAVGLLRFSGLENRIHLHHTESIELRWSAKGAIEYTIANLTDTAFETFDTTEGIGDSGDNSETTIQVGETEVAVLRIDEAGKLNLNTATEAQLRALPEMDEATAAAILDWRDRDQNARPGGVEGAYYSSLSPPYPIRDGPFQSLRELLLVKGVDAGTFFGEDTNLNGRLDPNEDDGDETPPADDSDGQLQAGWAAWLTCYSYEANTDSLGDQRIDLTRTNQSELASKLEIPSKYAKWIQDKHRKPRSIADLISRSSPKTPEDAGDGASEPIDLQTYTAIVDRLTLTDDEYLFGRINVNSAPRPVLLALTEGDETLADAIIRFRSDSFTGIDRIGVLIEDESIGVEGFRKIADKITVKSNVHRISASARSNRTKAIYRIELILDTVRDSADILYYHQGAGGGL